MRQQGPLSFIYCPFSFVGLQHIQVSLDMFSFSALKKSDIGRPWPFVCCVGHEYVSHWSRDFSHHGCCPQHVQRQILGAIHKDDMLVRAINLPRALQLPRACTIHSLDLRTAGCLSSGFPRQKPSGGKPTGGH